MADKKELQAFDLIGSILLVTQEALNCHRLSYLTLTKEQRLVVDKAFGLPQAVRPGFEIPYDGKGVAYWVATKRERLLVKDLREDERFSPRSSGYETDSFVSVPVAWGKRLFGVLNVADRRDGSSFDEKDLKSLLLIADHIALCLENQRLRENVVRLAATDPLTGVWNRRHFERRLDEEFAKAERNGVPLALLMIDVDNFKTFNDSHGHTAGDRILHGIARAINAAVRTGDIVCRYGGDEFAVILPRTDAMEALSVARRIGGRVVGTPQRVGDEVWKFTVSIGVSCYPLVAVDKRTLVDLADRAMYEAKYDPSKISLAQPLSPVIQLSANASPYMALGEEYPSPELATLIPLELARRLECIPVGLEGQQLTLAMVDPHQQFTLRVISHMTGLRVFPVRSSQEDIRQALKRMAALGSKKETQGCPRPSSSS